MRSMRTNKQNNIERVWTSKILVECQLTQCREAEIGQVRICSQDISGPTAFATFSLSLSPSLRSFLSFLSFLSFSLFLFLFLALSPSPSPSPSLPPLSFLPSLLACLLFLSFFLFFFLSFFLSLSLSGNCLLRFIQALADWPWVNCDFLHLGPEVWPAL